jgi:hypothetical protein
MLALAGCVGTVTREEFDAEVRARGGGFDAALVADAVEGIASEVGTADFEITNLNLSPQSGTVNVRVRDPRQPDQVDLYRFRDGELVDVEPVQLTGAVDLETDAFPISAFALDRLDEMVDTSLERFGSEGAYVTTLSFLGLPSSEDPSRTEGRVVIRVESPRAAADATLTAQGELLALEPR